MLRILGLSLLFALPQMALAQTVDRYVGTLPCADCSGIEIALTLRQTADTAGDFTMISLYQDKAEGRFVAAGSYSWDATTRQVRFAAESQLPDVQITDQGATMLGPDAVANPDYQLRRSDVFAGAGREVFVAPDSMIDARMDASGKSHISFDGLVNFATALPDGSHALIGRFDLDCAAMEVGWDKTIGYLARDGAGLSVARLAGADLTALPITEGDGFALAAARYCSA